MRDWGEGELGCLSEVTGDDTCPGPKFQPGWGALLLLPGLKTGEQVKRPVQALHAHLALPTLGT